MRRALLWDAGFVLLAVLWTHSVSVEIADILTLPFSGGYAARETARRLTLPIIQVPLVFALVATVFCHSRTSELADGDFTTNLALSGTHPHAIAFGLLYPGLRTLIILTMLLLTGLSVGCVILLLVIVPNGGPEAEVWSTRWRDMPSLAAILLLAGSGTLLVPWIAGQAIVRTALRVRHNIASLTRTSLIVIGATGAIWLPILLASINVAGVVEVFTPFATPVLVFSFLMMLGALSIRGCLDSLRFTPRLLLRPCFDEKLADQCHAEAWRLHAADKQEAGRRRRTLARRYPIRPAGLLLRGAAWYLVALAILSLPRLWVCWNSGWQGETWSEIIEQFILSILFAPFLGAAWAAHHQFGHIRAHNNGRLPMVCGDLLHALQRVLVPFLVLSALWMIVSVAGMMAISDYYSSRPASSLLLLILVSVLGIPPFMIFLICLTISAESLRSDHPRLALWWLGAHALLILHLDLMFNEEILGSPCPPQVESALFLSGLMLALFHGMRLSSNLQRLHEKECSGFTWGSVNAPACNGAPHPD
ncbi:MAG: hypothetical protein PWP23_1385 [Candidatus Sumerlaeota bacterium]|nr:hypothetical protein [Candidatus Sumerlaeota bacterium]